MIFRIRNPIRSAKLLAVLFAAQVGFRSANSDQTWAGPPAYLNHVLRKLGIQKATNDRKAGQS